MFVDSAREIQVVSTVLIGVETCDVRIKLYYIRRGREDTRDASQDQNSESVTTVLYENASQCYWVSHIQVLVVTIPINNLFL